MAVDAVEGLFKIVTHLSYGRAAENHEQSVKKHIQARFGFH